MAHGGTGPRVSVSHRFSLPLRLAYEPRSRAGTALDGGGLHDRAVLSGRGGWLGHTATRRVDPVCERSRGGRWQGARGRCARPRCHRSVPQGSAWRARDLSHAWHPARVPQGAFAFVRHLCHACGRGAGARSGRHDRAAAAERHRVHAGRREEGLTLSRRQPRQPRSAAARAAGPWDRVRPRTLVHRR